LIRSIKEKLLCLDGTTKVYPGHGPMTTISLEKNGNPFLI
jgi:glyoxylase-like metal-dependent hydrolase (beta-lactamase superfamily II)